MRQKLRGKTGCLNCRSGRKKCDEKTPVCGRCSLSGRVCEWPTSTQLVDRRFSSHPKSRHANSLEAVPFCHRSESAARLQLTQDLEVVIDRHFIEKYYNFLLLPNCHAVFYDGWINSIQELMVEDKSLRYSVLASAASHMHNTAPNPGMQSLALNYYSRSIKGLSTTLSQLNDIDLAKHDGFLMSIMLLYLHGCMSPATYFDIPPHLLAAMRVVTLRLFNNSSKIERPFDCLALESVAYNFFLNSTGLWSDKMPPTKFDMNFWSRAETILSSSAIIPDGSSSVNSPVLGIPACLFRLAIQAKQIFQHPETHKNDLDRLQQETEAWEALVLTDRKVDPLPPNVLLTSQQTYYESASYLYALIISLLLEQITAEPHVYHDRQLPSPVPRDAWQVQKALKILRSHEADRDWAGCFMGNWCIYTFGFFLSDPKDIQVVRNEMRLRLESTKFMQISRFLEDLEDAWKTRNCAQNSWMNVWENHENVLSVSEMKLND